MTIRNLEKCFKIKFVEYLSWLTLTATQNNQLLPCDIFFKPFHKKNHTGLGVAINMLINRKLLLKMIIIIRRREKKKRRKLFVRWIKLLFNIRRHSHSREVQFIFCFLNTKHFANGFYSYTHSHTYNTQSVENKNLDSV